MVFKRKRKIPEQKCYLSHSGDFPWLTVLLIGLLLSEAPSPDKLDRRPVPFTRQPPYEQCWCQFSSVLFASVFHPLTQPLGVKILAVFHGLFAPWRFSSAANSGAGSGPNFVIWTPGLLGLEPERVSAFSLGHQILAGGAGMCFLWTEGTELYHLLILKDVLDIFFIGEWTSVYLWPLVGIRTLDTLQSSMFYGNAKRGEGVGRGEFTAQEQLWAWRCYCLESHFRKSVVE